MSPSGARAATQASGSRPWNWCASPKRPPGIPSSSTPATASSGSTTSSEPRRSSGPPGACPARDEGRTWSKPEHLPAGLYGPIRAKPLVLPKGLIVSGSSVESYNSWAAWVERSTDFGKTWSRFGPIVPPEGGIIQPSVVQVEGKHLRFYARSNQMAKICVSDSYDDGVTWSPARPTDLPNPNSGIDVVHLKDGRYVVVYNHTPRGRTPLNLAVSRDGDHWTPWLTLESDPGEYSYPAMIQAADGTLHITYTWRRQKIKHVEIKQADIK